MSTHNTKRTTFTRCIAWVTLDARSAAVCRSHICVYAAHHMAHIVVITDGQKFFLVGGVHEVVRPQHKWLKPHD
jgi:hypothetical protein